MTSRFTAPSGGGYRSNAPKAHRSCGARPAPGTRDLTYRGRRSHVRGSARCGQREAVESKNDRPASPSAEAPIRRKRPTPPRDPTDPLPHFGSPEPGPPSLFELRRDLAEALAEAGPRSSGTRRKVVFPRSPRRRAPDMTPPKHPVITYIRWKLVVGRWELKASKAIRAELAAGRHFSAACYRAKRPGATRLRRKLVRREGGSACQRRIISRTARSFSRASAPSLARRSGSFFTGLLQNLEHRPVAGPTGSALAADDVAERRNQQRDTIDLDGRRSVPHPFE